LDAIRGVTKQVNSNEPQAETTNSDKVKSFDTDGFTLGTRDEVNGSGETYVGWNWLAATTFDPDTAGTLVGSGRSNSTAGFSIVAYTGNLVNGATFGHGLSQAPELVIVKSRSLEDGWLVGTTAGAIDFTDYAYLNTTVAFSDSAEPWNDTDPNATVVSLGTNTGCNSSGETYVAYCFHSVEGYSKVGSYEGNGNAGGTFVYTGFSPAYLMIKRTDSAKSWFIHDDKRSTYNVIDGETLKADTSGAEVSDTGMAADFDSNGFKLRTADDGYNDGTYLYLAFAKSPFKYANAR